MCNCSWLPRYKQSKQNTPSYNVLQITTHICTKKTWSLSDSHACDNITCGPNMTRCVPYHDAYKCMCPIGYHGKKCDSSQYICSISLKVSKWYSVDWDVLSVGIRCPKWDSWLLFRPYCMTFDLKPVKNDLYLDLLGRLWHSIDLKHIPDYQGMFENPTIESNIIEVG